ncbi:hypothetical protein BpHYR1_019079 [Brachionus plicatilis]|uniref:Uncharacterized protein n=1 Tax=Brachionus plicatilis TaxID=10195 RepID=A0A3M7RZB9_BRAPC|nr:hypothetical protein BpHYR1_019079 [Brachionus plicatilis]
MALAQKSNLKIKGVHSVNQLIELLNNQNYLLKKSSNFTVRKFMKIRVFCYVNKTLMRLKNHKKLFFKLSLNNRSKSVKIYTVTIIGISKTTSPKFATYNRTISGAEPYQPNQ